MSKYLFRASYTTAGVNGLINEGGSSRKEALGRAIESVGGTLESFYFAFGDDDLIMIVNLPDDASASALSLHISAAGALNVRSTVLIDPETVDDAAKKDVSYRAPGE